MAIVLRESNLAFYEIFKTGTTFIRRALTESNIEFYKMRPFSYFDKDEKNYQHRELSGFIRHSPWWAYRYVDKKYCCVRHPISWYESFWKFFSKVPKEHLRLGFFQNYFIDPQNGLVGRDFNRFIGNVIENQPAAYTRMVEQFVGPNHDLVKVIKTENLNQEIFNILLGLGYPEHIIADIRTMPKALESSKKEIVWDAQNKKDILELESGIIKRYYEQKI